MIIKSYDLDTPSVCVFHCNDIDIDDFKEILWGIEEESIPYKVEAINMDISENLSHKASLKSRVGIGIGISKDKITLTTNKLNKDKPLISIEFDQNDSTLRRLGSNSARLVKGIELKDI